MEPASLGGAKDETATASQPGWIRAREGSLEGGDDYVNAGVSPVRNTQILLTSKIDVGTLSCDGSSDPDNMTALVFDSVDPAAQCMVTRIGTPGGACDYLLKYKLETFSFDSLCSLDKTAWVSGSTSLPAASNHKQVAGANQVTFTVTIVIIDGFKVIQINE